MHLVLRLAVVAALAATCNAQPAWSPAAFAKARAPGYSSKLRNKSIGHWLQIHDDLAGAPRLITGLGLRGISGGTGAEIGFELDLSSGGPSSIQATSVLASNHGPNKVQVAAGLVWVSPQFSSGPANTVIPFATPFVYDGTGSICWDFSIHTNAGLPCPTCFLSYVDPITNSQQLLLTGSLGRSCANWGSAPPTLSLLTPHSATSTAFMPRVTGAPPGWLSVFGFGMSTSSFLGVPLPAELPWTAGYVTAPCYLYTDLVASVPAMVDPSGAAGLSYQVTLTPGLAGLDLQTQAFLLNPAQLGETWSTNAAEFLVIGPYGPMPVSTVNSGAVYLGEGLVTEFR